MPLRNPSYLDLETLLAQADYHDIDVPRKEEVVERRGRKRSAGGTAGLTGFGATASIGSDVEFQRSYTLTPSSKATVSRVIDGLIAADAVKTDPDGQTPLSKDDLVEVEGTARITAASLAGKMFHIFHRLMESSAGGLETIFDFDVDSFEVAEQLKAVYLRNELLPIPVLLEMTGSRLPQKVYVNLRPDNFVDAASSNRLEGEMRVLGSVVRLVDGGKEGYLGAEEWLLDGWEYLMRRKLMTQIDDVLKDLVSQLELDIPADDVHAYIKGPAVLVDAVALY
ncbi:hypothetical protein RKE38_10510 [Phycicoccus sp. M110.8]|uniref:DUF6414 family protein n=1 Tax=Phycicoccus sp. M110.8 TaxID=3075433 RepID=UPI0028FD3F04|nr:hypothetical protein [Phycicoccus sp. M110.8]MDU0314117.1 hypothetical protein [Phycicoccus sp. M110.8]